MRAAWKDQKMSAPSDDAVNGTGAATQTDVVCVLKPGSASALPVEISSTQRRSTIGNDLTIFGQGVRIKFEHGLHIDGDIFGDISGSDLTISSEGSVTGTVSAERVNVFGRIKGEIRAVTLILHPTAHVEADVLHQTLEIAEGAYFDGRVRRCRDVAELKRHIDVT
jgi:cytoskeletal protein CcmA (bactofilin family)